MSIEQKTWIDGAVLGLALLTIGCADDQGNTEQDETDTGEVGDGDGDPTGDPVPNDIPLELELARFNATGKYLLLRFSEPMAPVDGVDPADFRVSLASTMRFVDSSYYGPYVYESSRYADPNLYLGYSYYYDPYGAKPLVVDLVANGKQATDIVLRFVDPIEADSCAEFVHRQASYEEFDKQPNQDAKIALFPHYSPGAVPVKSADGEVLAAIGPEWVEIQSSYMVEYEFGWPNLDPQIEIPCTVGMDP